MHVTAEITLYVRRSVLGPQASMYIILTQKIH